MAVDSLSCFHFFSFLTPLLHDSHAGGDGKRTDEWNRISLASECFEFRIHFHQVYYRTRASDQLNQILKRWLSKCCVSQLLLESSYICEDATHLIGLGEHM